VDLDQHGIRGDLGGTFIDRLSQWVGKKFVRDTRTLLFGELAFDEIDRGMRDAARSAIGIRVRERPRKCLPGGIDVSCGGVDFETMDFGRCVCAGGQDSTTTRL
jgi:hypothetical protein